MIILFKNLQKPTTYVYHCSLYSLLCIVSCQITDSRHFLWLTTMQSPSQGSFAFQQSCYCGE